MQTRRSAAAVLVACGVACTLANNASAQIAPTWAPVAGYTVNLGLAGPASGPVRAVRYVGNQLLVLTESDKVFETTDFQHWKLNTQDSALQRSARPAAGLRAEAGNLVVPTSGTRRYSVTRENIFGSEDGHSWINLTGFNGQSIIGDGFTGLAVSPSNPLDIAAANQYGVWRSLDGGLSWQGINENLPNLNARRLAGQRTIVLPRGTELLASVTAGKWAPIDGVAHDSALRASLASRNGINASAVAQSGAMIYAGTADGHMFVLADENSAPQPSPFEAGGEVNRIWADPANPQAALAASGTKLFRTTNGGKFWDPVSGDLAAGTINGIAADSSAGVVYVATDSGVFSAMLNLNAADRVPAVWKSVQGNLQIARAWDARLNMDGTLTVLLDGYGVFEAAAPHLAQAPRIVNAADMSDRAAAPGSLISVLGANVKQATSQGTPGQGTSGPNIYHVLFASDESSQLQVPFEVAPGTLQLMVQRDGGGVWAAPLNVKQVAPAIFVNADGAPMIQDAASGLVVDSGTPIRGGSTIQVLATGLGRVTPEWPTGKPAPIDSPPAVVAPVTAFLDGTPINVTRATLAPMYVGNYLVELEIPGIVNRGAKELRIVVNGEESNRVKLYLEPSFTAIK